MIKKSGDFNEGGAVTWKETPIECLKSFQNIALFQNCNLQYTAGDSSADKVLTKFDVSQGFYTLEWLARYPVKGGECPFVS